MRGARTVPRLKFFSRNVLTNRPHIYHQQGRWKVRRVEDWGMGMVRNALARDVTTYWNGFGAT